MNICIRTDFHTFTSESIQWKNLGIEWLKSGHNVTFLNIPRANIPRANPKSINKIYGDLLPFVSNEPIGKYDVYLDYFDFINAGIKMAEANIYSGVFCWGLSPINKNLILNVMSERTPVFIAGDYTNNEFIRVTRDTYTYLSAVDHNIFRVIENQKINMKTTFIWVGFSVPSSCPDIVLKAFLEEFSSNDNVRLVMIDSLGEVNKLHDEIASEILNSKYKKFPEVVFISKGIDPKEMAELYNTATALVLPVRFHCECRPILEAMACGIPVVTTCYGGPAEYTDKDNAIYVNHTMEPAIDASIELENRYKSIRGNSFCSAFEFDEKFIWAKPDILSLSSIMRKIHENFFDLSALSNAGLQVAQKWSWKNIADNMIEIIERYK